MMIADRKELRALKKERRLLKRVISVEKKQKLTDSEDYAAHMTRLDELNAKLDSADAMACALWVPLHVTIFSVLVGMTFAVFVWGLILSAYSNYSGVPMEQLPFAGPDEAQICCSLVLVGLMFYYKRRYKSKGWFEDWDVDRKKLSCGKAILAMFSAMMLDFAVCSITGDYFIEGFDCYTGGDVGYITDTTPLFFISACVFAPIVEEGLLRGVMLNCMSRSSKLGALVFTSLCFGLMHGDYTQVFSATIGGLIYGYAYLEYGLRYSILLHALNNFTVCISQGIIDIETLYYGRDFCPVGGIVAFIYGILGIISLIWTFKVLVPRLHEYVAEFKANYSENKAEFILCLKRGFLNVKILIFIFLVMFCASVMYAMPPA